MAGPPYTLDQLGGFLAVVDEGSFSAAGRRLGRVQSAVSYGIAQLESALGTRLFDRRGHTPVLTDAGQRLAAEARLVLAQATELTECAARLHAGTEPSLRVVVDVAYPRAQLLAVCAGFRAQFAATTLRLEVGLLGDAIDVVLRGDADLGACNLAGASPAELALTHLGTVAIVPVCAPDHPLAKLRAPQRRALLEQSVQIVLSERSGALTSDQGVLATRTWRVTDLAVKADLLRRGVGWGSLPLAFAAPWLASGELVRLEPEPWPRDGHQVWIHAVVRKDRSLGRAGQWFRDQLRIDAPPVSAGRRAGTAGRSRSAARGGSPRGGGAAAPSGRRRG